MAGYAPGIVRVYLLDDHDIVRRGLSNLLCARRDITVVGDSASAQRAARVIPRLKPDLMVLDLHLQDGTGIHVCRAVRSVDPAISALLLTAAGDDEALLAAILAGAAGYVVKLAHTDNLVDAVRIVGAGKTLIDPSDIARVTGQLMAELEELRPRLTDYEHQILAHVLAGLTNRQIAERMGTAAEQLGDDVATLIERITPSALRQDARSDGHSLGKHRRTFN